ncbi:MAG: carboxypeptidase regulatory-like domain-containing protein, partial [Pyrinomonadaceae bacterium]
MDAGGAAVPDTKIVVTQVGTGAQRTVSSSADGNYSAPDLPIGIYRVAVSKTGFKEAVVENVTVNVSSITRQDVTLQVGGIGETVTITADAIQVETQTGTVGEVINGQQVRELPLNGRSFVQLTQLQPGVAPQNNFDSKNKGLFSGVDFSVNGNSAQSNLFLTDGANNNDTGSNRTILLYPSIEAIAEFKMLRNSYGPEYGQAAGAIISIATRGGENKFHGSLFYFGRNDALNATEYFSTRNGLKKDELRRNDFGGSLGGPIIKNRLFFFYSQEFNKELRGGSRFGSVPTVAERNGDFTNRRILSNGTSCDGPAIGNGRPGSGTQIIPAASISPAGQALIQLYPLPNLIPAAGSCNNWSASLASKIGFREENIRIDSNLTKKNQIFGRYTQDHWQNPFPILFGAGLWGDDAFPAVESSWAQPSRQAAIKLTTTLSNSSVNEVQFSYSANRINITAGNGADLNRQINQAIPGYFSDATKVAGIDRPHPVFWGGINPYYNNRGADLWTEAPFKNSLDIYSIRDDFSKVAGNHTFKIGFLFDKAAKTEDAG